MKIKNNLNTISKFLNKILNQFHQMLNRYEKMRFLHIKIYSIPSLFSQSSIACITLPDNLTEFGENWCSNTLNLVEVKISFTMKINISLENLI